MDRRTLLIDARRQAGTLRAEVNFRRSHQKESNDELEAAHWRLHRVIARGREALLRLSTFLETIGEDPQDCDDLVHLQASLEEAFLEKIKPE